jgi:polar amino acid transport system substrate-binding protein
MGSGAELSLRAAHDDPRCDAGLRACVLVAGLLLAVLAAGCDPVFEAFPRDPDATLRRIQDTHTLSVGVISEPPWTRCSTDKPAQGLEARIVSRFADSLGATPDWQCMSEAQAFAALEHQGLDLVIGGLTADSPRSRKAGFTRPYYRAGEEATSHHVMAAQRGENRFIVTLERFLEGEAARVRSALERLPQ